MSVVVAGLMHAIHDLPHDDLPRLAFADWLEEQGQTERAEFIRVQLELAKVAPADEKRFRPLHDREVTLMAAHKEEWFGAFRSAWRYYDCRRGFIEEVWGPAEQFLPHARWFLEHHALQQVCLAGKIADLSSVLRWPGFALLRSLNFDQDSPGASGKPFLTPCTEPLERRPLDLAITVRTRSLTGRGLVLALTAQPLPDRLTGLNLSGNQFSREALAILLDALPSWPKLVRLHLRDCLIAEDGITYLAGHRAISQIKEIDLSGNRLGGAGARALAFSPHLENIHRLVLRNGAVGLQALQARHRQRLRARFGSRIEGIGED